MGNVWLVLPSKRPQAEVLSAMSAWHQQGYNIALQRDESEPRGGWESIEVPVWRPYSGYAEAVNHLTKFVLELDHRAEWIVAAGDDTQPDMNHTAEEIAAQCVDHFEGRHQAGCLRDKAFPSYLQPHQVGTWGVMQPTGDRWGSHANTHEFTPRPGSPGIPQMCSQCGRIKDSAIHMVGAYIDRVAGSPWLGREFCLRINQGKGPLWPDYFHMGCDEELQAVATKLGIFWQRPDLTHLHDHWGRAKPGERMGSRSNMPAFLERANSSEEWKKYKALFAEREAAGFPGSEPL